MMGEKIPTCPFCGFDKLLESSAIVHEPYEDKELKVYRCLECGQGFNEDEMESQNETKGE